MGYGLISSESEKEINFCIVNRKAFLDEDSYCEKYDSIIIF